MEYHLRAKYGGEIRCNRLEWPYNRTIWQVLPAVLRSKELQKCYDRPYREYVESDNFAKFDFSLINYTDKAKTAVGNPYKYLPVIGAESGAEGGDDRINNGGLANTNYARLQYDSLSATEKERFKMPYCATANSTQWQWC